MIDRPLIDTGLLLALLDARDEHHRWAKKVIAESPRGFATCEAVLSETFFHIRKSERAKHAVLAMIEADWLQIIPVLPRLRVSVAHVLEKYHPRADYADACLVALHEIHGAIVFTTDREDFGIYRSRAGGLIPTKLPPTESPKS